MRITRSVVREMPVRRGGYALSILVDGLCAEIERDGNEVVSVSHTAHNRGFSNERIWTVLVTYCRASGQAWHPARRIA